VTRTDEYPESGMGSPEEQPYCTVSYTP